MALGSRESPAEALSRPKMNDLGNDRVKRLEEQVADLNARLPAHSVSPSIIEKLDKLEDGLEKAKKELAKDNADDARGC